MKERRVDHISPHLGLKSVNGKERGSISVAYDFPQTRYTKTRVSATTLTTGMRDLRERTRNR